MPLVENACNSGALQHYDYDSEAWVEDIDNDHTYTLIRKVRVAPNGSHTLAYSPDYNHDLDLGGITPIMEEQIILYGVGIFTRAKYPRNPTEWTEWHAQYWTEKELEVFEGKIEFVDSHESNFCGSIDLQNLHYVGTEMLDGDSVQHYAVKILRKTEDGYSSEEYWAIEYWIDMSERPRRIDTENRLTISVYHLFTTATSTFSNFGEENVIMDPLAPSNLE